MIFLQVLILLLLLVLCPFLIGVLSFRFLPRNRQSVALTFVTGQLLSFALFEVIAVPCMLLNRYDSFVFTYRIYLAGMVFFTAFGARDLILRLRRVGVLQLFPGDHFPEPEALMDPYRDITDYKQRYTKEAILYWALFFVLLFFQLYMLFTQASFDGDDAYYVTESVLAQQTGTMNRILPYTGISTTLDIRHALSVITMWTAFLAKASGIHAAIVAHTVLPLFFLIFTDLVLMESGNIVSKGVGTLSQYAQTAQNAAQDKNALFLDCYFGHEFNLDQYTTDDYLLKDGVHFTNRGRITVSHALARLIDKDRGVTPLDPDGVLDIGNFH